MVIDTGAWPFIAMAILGAFAAAYAWGRRAGERLGYDKGVAYAPLQLRRETWLRGTCLLCGGKPPPEAAGPQKGTAHGICVHEQPAAIRFAKMHTLGAGYVCGDFFTEHGSIRSDLPGPDDRWWDVLARGASQPSTGVGSHGLIAILPSQRADVRVRVFGGDGSQVHHYTSAIRCAAKYGTDHGWFPQQPIIVETDCGLFTAWVDRQDSSTQVRIAMGMPRFQEEAVPFDGARASQLGAAEGAGLVWATLVVDDVTITVYPMFMGGPQCVVFVPCVDETPVDRLGPLLERHPAFPEGTNVSFVQVVSESRLCARVWARALGEVPASDAGACAALVAAVATGRCNRRASVSLAGGELQVAWDDAGSVSTSAPIFTVCRGEFLSEWLQWTAPVS